MSTALRLAIAFSVCAFAPALPLAPAAVAHAKKAEEPASQKIVVSLKRGTEDLHAPFMAFKLGTMLQKGGAQVTLFLNMEGARLADSRQPANMTWGVSDAEIGAVMKGFIEAGGAVIVCPHCAKAAGLGPEDLREGMRIGTMEDLKSMFLEADKVIDY